MVALNVVIKDILNRILDMDDRYMPIGTIITSVDADFDPNDTYSGQTWEKISQGRFLMGADNSHAVGTTVNAGLPNIEGSIGSTGIGEPKFSKTMTGCFSPVTQTSYYSQTTDKSGYTRSDGIDFNASKSNSIYGASTTVQPPAYCVHFWKRIA